MKIILTKLLIALKFLHQLNSPINMIFCHPENQNLSFLVEGGGGARMIRAQNDNMNKN